MRYLEIDEQNRVAGNFTQPKPGCVEVDDATFEIHKAHPDYVWNGSTLVAPTGYQETLEEAKVRKNAEIQSGYYNSTMADSSYVFSTTLQKNINARRVDMDNVRESIEHVDEPEVGGSIPFSCFDDTIVNVNKSQLRSIRKELFMYGLQMTQKKRTLLQAVADAQTNAEVDAISW